MKGLVFLSVSMERVHPNTQPDLADACQNLNLNDADSEGLILDDDLIPSLVDEYQLCLVGRFLTEKKMDFEAMKNTLIPIWQSIKGMDVKELGQNRYIFRFFHERDLCRVLNDSPWSLSNQILILRRLLLGEQPSQVPLDHVEM